jgi:hypothetical protein
MTEEGEAHSSAKLRGKAASLPALPLKTGRLFEASLKRLRVPNRPQALTYSAQEPESLRGQLHSNAFRTGPDR